MKYGKEFQQILSDSHFPDEWKSSAIEYGQLKKLIKDVVFELSSMGLSPEILHKLLITEEPSQSSQVSHPSTSKPIPTSSYERYNGHDKVSDEADERNIEDKDDGDILEFEFESDESPPTLHPSQRALHSNATASGSGSRSKRRIIVDPMLDSNHHVESSTFPSSSLPTSNGFSLHDRSNSTNQRKFRVRLLSESSPATPIDMRSRSPSNNNQGSGIRPMNVSKMLKNLDPEFVEEFVPGSLDSVASSGDGNRLGRSSGKGKKVIRRGVSDGGAKAEYQLGDDSQHPHPQLIVHLPARRDSSASPSASRSQTSQSDNLESTDEEEDDERGAYSVVTRSTLLLSSAANSPETIKAARSPGTPDDSGSASPSLQKMRMASSPIFALASGSDLETGIRDLALDSQDGSASRGRNATETNSGMEEISTSEHNNQVNGEKDRDFVIPLASDQAFFNLLTAALTSLSSFHAAQQHQFRQSVENLCKMISASIQPGSSSITIIPTPLTSAPTDSQSITRHPSNVITDSPSRSKTNKKDLYVWREIFTLWIESEIFESASERTRGERTIEEAEKRLKKFAKEVVKRGLGDRRTLKGKKTREAWEEFLRLNVLLLDLKRFQLANINAARKILKKHDKRTALTASTGFQSFVRTTLESVGQDGNVNTWTFYNTSLPHVLLASLTDTLLPILPSLDDYACLICTSIAFKPIRLACSHLFCVRCLVKMQRAGKAECPLCRSKVVLLANKDSLDTQVMTFMKEWFPKEVKEKEKENDVEINREVALQVKKQNPDCIIQ